MGAVLGGAISQAATWGVELRRESRIARNFAVAASSELAASIGMVKVRNWRDAFVSAANNAYAGNVYSISVHTKDDYLPMCRAAMAHAGSIDHDLAILLGRILTLTDSLIADIKRISSYTVDTPESLLSTEDPEGAARVYNTLVNLLDAAIITGDQAIQRVDLIYPRPARGLVTRMRAAWRAFKS
ncbi:hypothetical protein [Lysobacter sp. Root76]|nr:hypothetical protein [Lysobacter sp. Root76]